MKNFYRSLTAFLMLFAFVGAKAQGWPANYEGVMLQGFYWDSYEDTKWTNLEAQADELSKYFDLIWVPNSGKSASNPSMGYDPIYWFSNHNSNFGTEAEIRQMIKTFKAKGVGIIEDVVVNHRSGATNWTNFPKETWNGQTFQIGTDGICNDDEVNYDPKAAGEAKGTGAKDTGEGFIGSRDLDHTNANVQNNVKNYCKFLLDDMGYAGFRLDMVKGYSGQYTKIYNEYSKPKYSVGEYWDGNYDAVANWIKATGYTSAAFDFPGKYQLNKALNGGENLTELVWKAYGVTDQPAGMIHCEYGQYAVTFVDNHDTYRDGSKFTGNVLAANAFILCSPGTPCVFLKHYKENTTKINEMILARKKAGIHNCSAVKVLKTGPNIYMAEVTGTKGSLVIKIGSENGSSADSSYGSVFTSGNNYAIWVKEGAVSGGNQGGNSGTPSGESFTVYFDNSSAKWTTPYIHYWGNSESTWPGVAMQKVSGDVWSYTVPAGTTGLLFNAGDGDNSKTSDFVAQANHIYTEKGDQGVYSGAGNSGNSGNTGNSGSSFTVYFDNSSAKWATPYIHYWGNSESTWPGVPMVKDSGDVWSYTVPAGTTGLLFNAGDGDNTKTKDFVALANHIYTKDGDQGVYSGAGNSGDPGNNQGGNNGEYPEVLYMIGNVNGLEWSTAQGVAMTKSGSTYTVSATIDDAGAGSGYFHFVTVLGPDWDAVNEGDRYGAPAADTPIADGESADITPYLAYVDAMGCQSWMIAAGTYTFTVDLSSRKLTIGEGSTQNPGGNEGNTGGDPGNNPGGNEGDYPAVLYMIGNVNGLEWSTAQGVAMTKSGSTYTVSATIDDAGAGSGYFHFVTVLGADWDAVNEGDRYGAPSSDYPAKAGESYDITPYLAYVDAMGCQSWMIAAGTYTFTVDLSSRKLTIGDKGTNDPGQGGTDIPGQGGSDIPGQGDTDNPGQGGTDIPGQGGEDAGVDGIQADEAEPIFFNLQGVEVKNPGPGLYIKVTPTKREKVVIR